MTWTAPAVDRVHPMSALPEREMYDGWLEYHRQTLLWKCAGLNAEQLKRRATPPSTLTLLSLVRHCAQVERYWFRRFLADEDVPPLYGLDDEEFHLVDAADAEADFASYHAEVAAARAVAAGRGLDDTFQHYGAELSLRWVYVHLIEEYARHNGHADLLREAIDGETGD